MVDVASGKTRDCKSLTAGIVTKNMSTSPTAFHPFIPLTTWTVTNKNKENNFFQDKRFVFINTTHTYSWVKKKKPRAIKSNGVTNEKETPRNSFRHEVALG